MCRCAVGSTGDGFTCTLGVARVRAPLSLDFHRVPFFPGAMPPNSHTRSVTITNDGTGVLRLGVAGQAPFFEVVPTNATTQAAEFTVVASRPEAAAGAAIEVSVTFTPVSLGPKAAELRVLSNDPNSPTIIRLTATAVSLSACSFSVTPLALGFGTVSRGDRLRRGVSVQNTGSTVCLFSNLKLTGAEFELVNPPDELEVSQGASAVVFVDFRPAASATPQPTSVVGLLVMNVSSPGTPVVQVALSGSSFDEACLFASPREVDFGSNAVGCGSAPKSIVIGNRCTTPVNLVPMVAGSNFSLTTAPGTSLLPGSVTTAQVSWRPSMMGTDVGALVVAGFVVPLVGTGRAAGPSEETHVVPGVPKADVLLVVDDSCSMTPHQLELSSQMPGFIQACQASSADVRIGVVTTDLDLGGALAGSPRVLTLVTPNVAQVLSQRVRVGIAGNPIESTFASAALAVSPPRTLGTNLGLVRDDASLHLLGVSDSDDQSPHAVGYWHALFSSLKPVDRLTFTAITPLAPQPPPGTCLYDTAGTRTPGLAAFLGGTAHEICSGSFTPGLEAFARTVLVPQRVFTLRAPVHLTGGALEVRVNGQQVDPLTTTGSLVWSFSAATNQLRFEPLYAPDPGATVSFSYPVACGP